MRIFTHIIYSILTDAKIPSALNHFFALAKTFPVVLLICMQLQLSPAFAQSEESFAEILVKANKAYENGNFNEAITLATSCSIEKAVLSDQWKVQRLLTIIYLADGQSDQARTSAEKMLELNPTYKPNYLKDPAELIKLLKSITVIPKFSLGLALSLGTNSTFPEITKGFVLSDYNKTYTSENSFQFGLSSGYTLSEHLQIDLGCLATRKAYQIDYALSNWNVSVDEKLTYLDFPLMAKYILYPRKRWHITIQGGLFAGFLLFSENNFKATFTPQNKLYELSNVNSTSRRNLFNYGFVGGVGGTYKIEEGDLYLQMNFYKSLANITNEASRYKYNELVYNYFYEDDDIILSNLSITIGYAFYLNYKILQKK
ncbi:MAG: porin family protein [Bacteroidia bacterium]